MARFMQLKGTEGISVALSSVDYGNNTQLNYTFSLSDEIAKTVESVVPNLIATVDEQQKTIDRLTAEIIDLKVRVEVLENE